ncbi:MAG: hypothetical protein GY866_42715 [Proteobacteria bacterium]|nr:hypothetical protein [Pseudomonadota bacterium]
MKLAVIFLNRVEYLDDLLTAFLEIGVSGATVLDSVGMGHIISENVPIFAGLRETFAGSSPRNKVILIATEEEMIVKIAEVMDDVCVDIDETNAGFLVSVPIDNMFGLK